MKTTTDASRLSSSAVSRLSSSPVSRLPSHDLHIPVLLDETIEALRVRPGGRYVDGTFGRGGHSRAILAAGGEVLGIDRDEAAVTAGLRLGEEIGKFQISDSKFQSSEFGGQRLPDSKFQSSEFGGQRLPDSKFQSSEFGGQRLPDSKFQSSEFGGQRLRVVKGRHGDLKEIANENGWNEVDGVLLDLGVSSPQLDDAGRGFSFLREGPLDMRMDRSGGLTAADLVNGESAERLTEIFRDYGEEPQARRIAKAIVGSRSGAAGCRTHGDAARRRVYGNEAECRAHGRFETTTELADFVEKLIGRRGGHHPATRVFQALRMAVNDEIGELERALAGALALLAPNGRIAVITFESLTDRIVKRFFADHVGREVSLQAGGSRWEGSRPRVRAVTRRAVTAQEREISINPRSRSAKLRAVEREG